MQDGEGYLIVALVGERIEQSDGSIEVGTIVMGERRTRAEAEAECRHRKAQTGCEYIVMSTAEHDAMCRPEWTRD